MNDWLSANSYVKVRMILDKNEATFDHYEACPGKDKLFISSMFCYYTFALHLKLNLKTCFILWV